MADTDNENYEEQGAVGGQHLDDTDRLSIDRDLAEFNLQPQNNSSETPMRALTVAHSSPNNHDSPYDSAPGTVQRLRSSGGENAEAVQQIDSMVSRLRPDSGLAPNILLARGVDGLSQQDPNVDVLMSQLSDIDINTLMSALTKKLKSASKPQRDLQQIKVLLDAETPRVLFTWPRGFEYTGLNRDEFTVTPYQPSVLDGYVILQLTINVPESYHLIRERDQSRIKNSMCSMLKDYLPDGVLPRISPPLSPKLADRCELQINETRIEVEIHLLPQEQQALKDKYIKTSYEPPHFDENDHAVEVVLPLILKKCSRDPCPYCPQNTTDTPDERDENSDQDREGNRWSGNPVQPEDSFSTNASDCSSQPENNVQIVEQLDENRDSLALKSSPNFWKAGSRTLTLNVPQEYHLIRETDQIVKGSVCSMLKDYLPGVFSPKSTRPLSDRCEMLPSNGVTQIKLAFHLLPQELQAWDIYALRKDPEPAIFDYTESGAKVDIHTCVYVTAENLGGTDGWIGWMVPDILNSQAEHYQRHLMVEVEVDVDLHHAAQQKSPEHLQVILNSVEYQADRYQLLLMEDKYGRTPVHLAAQRKSSEHLRVIFNSVDSQENRYKLLLIKNKVGETPLHHAAQQESPEHLQVILNSVDSQADRYKLLLMEGEYGRTALHHAARRESPEHLQVILNSLECQEKRLKLLQIKKIDTIFHIGFLNDHEATPVHLAAQRKSSEHLRVIFNSVDSQADRYQLLLMEDKYGRTPLHHAAQQISPEHLQVIFNSVDSQADRYKLPLMKNDFGETPLHHAAQQESREHMKVLLIPLLCQKKCLKLLQNKKIDTILHIEFLNDHEATPVHLAAQRKSPIHLQVILTLEDSQADRYQLLQMEDKNKRTALHHAEKQSLSTRDCSCDLSAYPAEELNFIGVGNQSHYRRSFARNIKGKVIICQSPHVEKRPICQDRASPSGFILYNCANRRGAQDEAQNFEHKLQQIGYGVITIGWSHTDELVKLLSCKSNTAQHTIAPLILSIMTHGHKGILSGTNNSEISINSLLHQLEKSLPPTKPLVLIIQACQAALLDTAELDRTKPKHAQDQSIELSRPNTVLMLATVEGGLAYRGAFTGAIADEISKADGVTSIDTMFSRAVVKTRQIDPHQIPEIRSTMKEPLVLPSGPKPQS